MNPSVPTPRVTAVASLPRLQLEELRLRSDADGRRSLSARRVATDTADRRRPLLVVLLTAAVWSAVVQEPAQARVAYTVLSSAGLAVEQRPGSTAEEQTVLYTSRRPSGATLEYRVPEKRLLLTKMWTPEREPPPLTIAAAVAVAKKRSKPTHPDDLQVISINMGCAAAGEAYRWDHTVGLYDRSQAYGDTPPGTVDVVVLMDGSVVEPVQVR